MFDSAKFDRNEPQPELTRLAIEADTAFANGDRFACIEAINSLYRLFRNDLAPCNEAASTCDVPVPKTEE